GLGRVGQHEATFMHNRYFQGISQEYLGFASAQGWGINANFVNSGDIARTTISNPDGTGLGNTKLTDLALGAGYGWSLDDFLVLGAGFKYIRESAAGISATGYAVDLGALYSLPAVKGLNFGFAIQNIGPRVKFQSANENLPLNIRGGAAYSFSAYGQNSTVAVDIMQEASEGVLAGLGLETVIAGMMPVRLGFNTRNEAGPGITAGMGWIYGNCSIDYAFVPFGELGTAHRISVSVRWGKTAHKSNSDTSPFISGVRQAVSSP
ncbi:MAG: PorV/PorQ family protein, partial [bacterium]